MDYSEKAKQLFKDGYNCSQAVFCAFCDKTGIEQETAAKIASSFGGGMGRLGEVCGAVSAMFMVIGALYGYSDPKNSKLKSEHYSKIQQLAAEFKKTNGSVVCRELLASSSNNSQNKRKHSCIDLVYEAAQITEKFIAEQEEKF